MPQIGEVKTSKELGRVGTYRFIWCACIDCGKERWVPIVKQKPNKERCNRCGRKGEKASNWKGGRHIGMSGYVDVKIYPEDPFYSMAMAGGYIREHRLVMARFLGRCLERSELIHHLNGIKIDNRIKNLCIMPKGKHSPYILLKEIEKRLREVEGQLAQQRLI